MNFQGSIPIESRIPLCLSPVYPKSNFFCFCPSTDVLFSLSENALSGTFSRGGRGGGVQSLRVQPVVEFTYVPPPSFGRDPSSSRLHGPSSLCLRAHDLSKIVFLTIPFCAVSNSTSYTLHPPAIYRMSALSHLALHSKKYLNLLRADRDRGAVHRCIQRYADTFLLEFSIAYRDSFLHIHCEVWFYLCSSVNCFSLVGQHLCEEEAR